MQRGAADWTSAHWEVQVASIRIALASRCLEAETLTLIALAL